MYRAFHAHCAVAKADKYYRNKLEYTFSNKRWLYDGENREDGSLNMNALGFHIPGRFDKILDVNHCWLQAEPSNSLRNSIREFVLQHGYSFYDLKAHTGTLRNLVIRTSSTGEVMVIVVFAYADQEEMDKLMGFIEKGFPEITSLLYIINQKKNDTIFDQDVVAVLKGLSLYTRKCMALNFASARNRFIRPILYRRLSYMK